MHTHGDKFFLGSIAADRSALAGALALGLLLRLAR